jgi:hypothetical protein
MLQQHFRKVALWSDKDFQGMSMSRTITKQNNDKQNFHDCYSRNVYTYRSAFIDVTQQEYVTSVKSDIRSRNFESQDFQAKI